MWLILAEPPFGAGVRAVVAVLVGYSILLIASMASAAWVYILTNPRNGRSLIFFEDISAMPFENFEERAGRMDAVEIERQLIDRIHVVSGIASKRMRLVGWSCWAGAPSVLLWVILIAWASVRTAGRSRARYGVKNSDPLQQGYRIWIEV